MRMETYAIGSSQLTYDLIEKILRDNTKLTLSEEGRVKIQHCRDYLDRKTDDTTKPIYGVTNPISVRYVTNIYRAKNSQHFREPCEESFLQHRSAR